jgi:hypothetical protein
MLDGRWRAFCAPRLAAQILNFDEIGSGNKTIFINA